MSVSNQLRAIANGASIVASFPKPRRVEVKDGRVVVSFSLPRQVSR